MAKSRDKQDDSPRQGRVRPAGELIGEIGGVAFKRFGFVQGAVVSRWSEIVGERYASVSLPESIRSPSGSRKNGTLTLLSGNGIQVFRMDSRDGKLHLRNWTIEAPDYVLAPGHRLVGPAVVEQTDTTTVVEPGMELEVDHDGNLLVRVK